MNIAHVVFGNVCSLLAMGTDSISSSRKTLSGMLWIQNISQLFYGVGSIALKGYSGTVQNVICIIRNLAIIKGIKSKLLAWALVILGIVVGLYFNNLGIKGLLPIIANTQYSLVVFKFEDNERAIKISFLISAVLFAAFGLVVFNFVGVCTNLAVAIVTFIFLIKTRKRKDK